MHINVHTWQISGGVFASPTTLVLVFYYRSLKIKNMSWASTAALGLFKSTRKSLWNQGFVIRENDA